MGIGCHVMAKPSSSVCNIDCEYCFYLEKELLYPNRKQKWKMSEETLDAYIKQFIEAQPASTIEFVWQGGEPTLLGISFFRKAISLCNKYSNGKTITHSFQTNGLLLNDAWCSFFKENNFLIGISIDGPEDLHDRYRVTRSEKGTHAKVILAIELLKKHRVEFNTLVVVSDVNVIYPNRVYDYLKSIGSKYIQFIPLVERDTNVTKRNIKVLASPSDLSASVTKWSVNPSEFGHFLNTIYDNWFRHDVGKVFVQMFDSTLASWLSVPGGSCVFSKYCGHAFALESNGDLYQCDHFVYPEYKLGNIHSDSIAKLNHSDAAVEFGKNKYRTLNEQCHKCRYKLNCFGGCPKHRFKNGSAGKPDHNFLCEGYYAFFQHSEESMAHMRNLIKQRRPVSEIMKHYAE